MNNPMSWLPKPGQAVQVPGGQGRIVFQFFVGAAEYEAAMQQRGLQAQQPIRIE